MSDRRVLVTGASGFIGRSTLGPLADAGFDVHAVSRTVPDEVPPGVRWMAADLLDAGDRQRVVAATRPTHLLHLAWYAEPGAFWAARENAAWVAATVDLAEAFVDAGGERIVGAGTCAEYDWTVIDGPIREDAPIAPATFYGVCKDATRRVLDGLAAQAGIGAAWGRVFFLYGPGEDERRLVGGTAAKLARGERAPASAGTQVRDFLHVDDVGRAFAALVAADVAGPVNVASGEGVTVREIVETLARVAGAEELLEVGALPMRGGDPPEIVGDARRLDEVCTSSRVTLIDGLAAMVAAQEP